MGSRIEKILLFLIVIIATIPFFFKYNNHTAVTTKKVNSVKNKKSSEFIDFIKYQVGKKELSYKLSAKKAEEIGENWYVTNPKIVNKDIKSLTSKKAIVQKNDVKLIDDVKLYKVDGKSYLSKKAIYNLKTKVIKTPKKFTIFKEHDLVKGRNLEYDTLKKETKAKDVSGIFVIKK